MAAELFVQQLCMQKHSFFTLRVSGGLDPVVICSGHGLEIFSAMRRPINRAKLIAPVYALSQIRKKISGILSCGDSRSGETAWITRSAAR